MVAAKSGHAADTLHWGALTAEWHGLEERWSKVEADHEGVEDARRQAERSYLKCRTARTTSDMDTAIRQMEQIQADANAQRQAIEAARRDLQAQRDRLDAIRVKLDQDPAADAYLDDLFDQVLRPMRDLMGQHDQLTGWYGMYGDTMNQWSAAYEDIASHCDSRPRDTQGLLERIVAASRNLAAVASDFLALEIETGQVAEP
ncbi:MAG: hypothetical protein OXS50_00535 [Gammaproteobacteria bacterium]|nr:hypothetical protein [Gammaproteobacteria bacterium]